MKIYTRTGDAGETGLFGGPRVPKHHPRVDAYGSVDELNAVLGVALLDVADPWIQERLAGVQHDLFDLGAELATPAPAEGRRRPETPPLPSGRIAEMEMWIDAATEELEPLRRFILPGGTRGSASLHVARAVCRRAEREVTSLAEAEPLDKDVIRYLNRLSDLLFALARLDNARAGVADVVWESRGDGS